MPVRLVSLENGPSIVLDKPILLLGRHQECDVQIDSRKISRRHCCIAQVENTLLIRDLDSTNGIKVNGERVREAHLVPGDEVTIGNLRYRVVSEARAEPVRRAPVNPGDAHDRTFEDDDLLESSEVPIALQDDGAVPIRRPEDPSGETHAADEPVLPDEMNLTPSNNSSHPSAPPS